MANKCDVKPLTEHVLGMTVMSDLARMRALAGLPAEDCTSVAASAPTTTVEIIPDDGDECCVADPKEEIEKAIASLEKLMPMIRVGDYKKVSQRIYQILNVISESAYASRATPIKESFSYADKMRNKDYKVSPDEYASHLNLLDVLIPLAQKLKDLTSKLYNEGMIDNEEAELFQKINDLLRSMQVPVSLLTVVEKPSLKLPGFGKKLESARRSFKDYVAEAEAEQQTIGKNRPDAVKNLQTRMGDGTTIQDASKAFDKMRTTGKIKQNGTTMTMPAVGDDELKNIAGTGNSGVK